jgi:hypothetical protein
MKNQIINYIKSYYKSCFDLIKSNYRVLFYATMILAIQFAVFNFNLDTIELITFIMMISFLPILPVMMFLILDLWMKIHSNLKYAFYEQFNSRKSVSRMSDEYSLYS